MYLLKFVNQVRRAQGYENLERMPISGDPGCSPLELAMGCRLESGLMRLSTPEAAADVSAATSLPLGLDRVTVALPSSLDAHASSLQDSRSMHGREAQTG